MTTQRTRRMHFARSATVVALAFSNLGAAAQQSCAAVAATARSTGFSVFAGGRVELGPNDSAGRCAVTYQQFNQINVAAGNLQMQGRCTQQDENRPIVASGVTVNRLALPTFQTTSSRFEVVLASSSRYHIGNNSRLQHQSRPDGSNNAVAVAVDGRTITVPSSGRLLTLPAGEYQRVQVQNGNSIGIAGGSVIRNLSLNGCNSNGRDNGLVLAPGNYFIENFTWEAGCDLSLEGDSGTVNLYVRNGFQLTGGPTRANWIGGPGNQAAQRAERLRLYVYQGNMSFQAAVFFGGAVYVDRGDFIAGTSSSRFAGEVVAANIRWQNNADTVFRYQQTGVMGFAGNALRDGFYSLAPPAVPPKAAAGDLVYVASQRDKDATNTNPMTSGHLHAYAITAAGALAGTASWDAAALMTVAQRRTAIQTESSTAGALTALTGVDSAAFGPAAAQATTLIETIIDPNFNSGAMLYGRNPRSLVGRPWRTAPILVENLVVFAASDGLIYGINRATGALVWAFIAREMLSMTAAPSGSPASTSFEGGPPWGQLSYARSGSDGYLMATGLQGQLHIGLRIDPSTGALQSVAWKDYRVGLRSPDSPFGGAAPSLAVRASSNSSGRVYYVVGNLLVHRPFAGGAASEATLPSSATSNLVVVDHGEIYYGDGAGNVVRTAAGTSGTLASSRTMSMGESPADPVLGLNAAYLADAAGAPQLYLVANSDSRVRTFNAGTGAALWYTERGASSANTVTRMPADSRVTAMASVVEGRVLIPASIATNASDCSQQGYMVGPLSLESGASVFADSTLRAVTMTGASNRIGNGESLNIQITRIGTTTIVAGSSSGGNSTPAAGWAPLAWPSRPVTPSRRANWRELTHFIP